MLVYKLKQHSKQYTDLKYVIYIEMTDLKTHSNKSMSPNNYFA